MKGLELARAFFEECGRPMLEEQFPELLPYLAAGLCGSGSECLGYDDETSRDHDFEPGFCLFLPGEDVVSRRSAFLLERAYAKLPGTFMGVQRQKVLAVGGARLGVLRTADFFRDRTGTENGSLDLYQWLAVPEQSLLEATNGELYFDNYGEVTRIREALSRFPEDIRRKRLAGELLLAAQSGQYNYSRCLKHGETGAAQMALFEFVKSAVHVVFLLNGRYQPYYKWAFRALRELPVLSELSGTFEVLLSGERAGKQELAENPAGELSGVSGRQEITEHAASGISEELIEQAASEISQELRNQGLTEIPGNELEQHAYSVNGRIKDPMLRNMHVLAAV